MKRCLSLRSIGVLVYLGALMSVAKAGSFHVGAGQPMPAIVLPSDPTPAEKFAAQELQAYLAKITGRTSAIEQGTPASAQPRIELSSDDKVDPDTFSITVEPALVRIVGGFKESPDAPKAVQERGVIFGVYELLEQLGVRWYRPESWGEHVPQSTSIDLPLGTKTYTPGYQYRFGFSSYFNSRKGDKGKIAAGTLWGVRMRQNVNAATPREMGGSYAMGWGHSYSRHLSPDKYFQDHPEYFALRDGKRVPNGQLCLSNPEVQRIVTESVIRQAKAHPEEFSVSVDPNDFSLWCECDQCRAMDDPNLLSARAGVSMSNRVCAFNNIIARQLAAAVPGATINWYAYNLHTEVPTLVKKLEPNSIVWAAPYSGGYSDWSRPLEDGASSQNVKFLEVLKGYSGMVTLFAREYFGGYYWFGPMPNIAMLTDRMRTYRKYGVRGIYTQGDFHWGPQSLSYYMAARLMWNPDLDVPGELDLYYQNYYGPAAAPMKRYHELMETAAASGDKYFGSGGTKLEDVFTADLIAKLQPQIEEARTLVKGQAVYEKRMEGVWAGFEYARRVREFTDLEDRQDLVAATKALEDLRTFIFSYKDEDVFENNLQRSTSSMPRLDRQIQKLKAQAARQDPSLKNLFDSFQTIAELNKDWKFQPDPRDEGGRLGWMRADVSTASWATVDAERVWQDQGFSGYLGVAWYRKEFVIPDGAAKGRTVIYIGAIDGNATVYINGQVATENKLSEEGGGHDVAVYSDISKLIHAEGSNLIAIRVEKKRNLAGLYKGVKLLGEKKGRLSIR